MIGSLYTGFLRFFASDALAACSAGLRGAGAPTDGAAGESAVEPAGSALALATPPALSVNMPRCAGIILPLPAAVPPSKYRPFCACTRQKREGGRHRNSRCTRQWKTGAAGPVQRRRFRHCNAQLPRPHTGGATYIHLRRQSADVKELCRARALQYDDARDHHQRCRSAEDDPPAPTAQHTPANPQRVNPSPGRAERVRAPLAKLCKERACEPAWQWALRGQHATSHPRSLDVQCSFLHLAADAITRRAHERAPAMAATLRLRKCVLSHHC